jgi:hypothetical protein
MARVQIAHGRHQRDGFAPGTPFAKLGMKIGDAVYGLHGITSGSF